MCTLSQEDLIRDEEIFNDRMIKIRALETSNAEMDATIQSLRRQCQQSADMVAVRVQLKLGTSGCIVPGHGQRCASYLCGMYVSTC